MLIIYTMAAKGKRIVTYGDIKYQDVLIRYSMFICFQIISWSLKSHMVIFDCTLKLQ